MHNWDYDLDQKWQPKTDEEWQWYLVRVINYGHAGTKLDKGIVKKYLPMIKIEPWRRRFLEFILYTDENNSK